MTVDQTTFIIIFDTFCLNTFYVEVVTFTNALSNASIHFEIIKRDSSVLLIRGYPLDQQMIIHVLQCPCILV